MNRAAERTAWWMILAGCVPYLAVRLYWRHLLTTLPGAEHGELSGPITYLLPRLLWVGIAVAVFAFVAAVLFRIQRSISGRKKMQKQSIETTRETQL